MKTKSLFLTLALLLLLPLSMKAAYEDVILWSDLVDAGYLVDANELNNIDGLTKTDLTDGTSSAEYGGWLGYLDDGDNGLYLNSEAVFGSKVSGGKLKSIKVNWMEDWNAEGDKLFIYGASSKFDLDATYSDIAESAPSLIATFTYTEGDTYAEIADVLSVGNFEHFIITTDGGDVYFSSIEVKWQTIVKYGLTLNAAGRATLSSDAEYEAGANVYVSIVPSIKSGKNRYELRSYQIGEGPVVDLGVANYTQEAYALPVFVMEEGGVTINATLVDPITRKDVYVYFHKDATEVSSDDITSDENYTYTFQLKYKSGKSYYNLTDYTGSITTEIENSALAACVGAVSFDAASGSGSFTVKGLMDGSTRVVLNVSQDANYKRKTAYLGLTIFPKDIMLLTTFNDKWYVMKNTLNGSNRFNAEEVLYVNGTIYYNPGSDPSDFTWQSLSDGSDYVLISGGLYLGTGTAGKFTLSSTKTLFGKDPDDSNRLSKEGGIGICIQGTQFGSYMASTYATNDSYSPSVIMVDLENVAVASQVPTRSQTDTYYSTMCFPFPITRSSSFISGLGDVYSVSGVFKAGDVVQGIELELVEDAVLAAGTPYIYVADGAALDIYYGEKTTADPIGYATGLVGNLESSKLYVPGDGNCYGIKNNQIRRVLPGATASVGQYKAYIDVTDLPTAGAASAPGRKVMYAYNQEDTATSLEDFLNNATFINWNEPVYNTLGQQVGKGTTGVLIQNGKKFLVQ